VFSRWVSITNVHEIPDTIREAAIVAVSGDELLLRTHLHRSRDEGIRNKTTRSVASRPGRRINLEEPQITLNVHSSHGGSLGNSPSHGTAIMRLYIEILNTSPEVVKSTDSVIIAAVLAPQIVDLGVLGGATKTESLGVETNVHGDIVNTWFEENSISAFRELTMVSRFVTTLLRPNGVNNILSIRLARAQDLDIATPGRRVGLGCGDSSCKHKIGKLHMNKGVLKKR